MKPRNAFPHELMANPDRDKVGPNGRLLCRWCGVETKPPRIAWCSKACNDEFLIRFRPGSARHAVWRRDKGRCALCHLNCTKLKSQLHRIKKRKGFKRFVQVVRVLGIAHYRYGTLWNADHVTPVVEGGGMCGLDNLRTLCLWCHRGETRKLNARRKQKKAPRPRRSKGLK